MKDIDEQAYEPKTPAITDATKVDPNSPNEYLFDDDEIDSDSDEVVIVERKVENKNE